MLLYDFMKRIDKVPIRVPKEHPGYLINAIHIALMSEAGRLWAEGIASAEDTELGVEAAADVRHSFTAPSDRDPR